MAKEFKLSAERLEELKQELNYLKTVREKEVADQIKEARSFGDLSENSEYDEAKNEQGKLYSRIAEVENILANYVVIEEHETDPNSVRLGSKVKVLDLEYQVVGSQEADPMNGRISEDSPFGKALLGNAVGDEVQVEAPAGVLRYRILEIQK
jgi:transcription elongation factor GreA